MQIVALTPATSLDAIELNLSSRKTTAYLLINENSTNLEADARQQQNGFLEAKLFAVRRVYTGRTFSNLFKNSGAVFCNQVSHRGNI